MPAAFTRRDFLRLSSLSLVGAAFKPLPPEDRPDPIFYGRVLMIYMTVYSRPSAFGRTVRLVDREGLVPVYAELQGEDSGAYNRLWYRTTGGFIHSTNVQPVQIRPNWPEAVDGPRLGEVTLPYADARAGPRYSARVVYRLYYSTTHWVQRLHVDREDQAWYELWDERFNDRYYVPAAAVRLVSPGELDPLSPNTADKQIRIDTTAQTITALESGQAVLHARISSGAMFRQGASANVRDYRTPLGSYAVDRKRPSRHMAAGDLAADDSYDLPGVPWVSYFNGGIAVHGTYWHNDFGRPWSHGCINVRPDDAKWFYRWTMPVAQADQALVEARGTAVVVV